MVLDSAFSNLYNLMMELVDVYKIRLPKFTVISLSLDANSLCSKCSIKEKKGTLSGPAQTVMHAVI